MWTMYVGRESQRVLHLLNERPVVVPLENLFSGAWPRNLSVSITSDGHLELKSLGPIDGNWISTEGPDQETFEWGGLVNGLPLELRGSGYFIHLSEGLPIVIRCEHQTFIVDY